MTDLSPQACSGCGNPAGDAGCQTQFEALLARDFSDLAYFQFHRLLVDTYSLQHPDRYCVSAKSLAAHLTGLCWALEHGGSTAVGSDHLRRWLDGRVRLKKPAIPVNRGEKTVQEVATAPDLETHETALVAWAKATWKAYSDLHPIARQWIAEATDVGQRNEARG